MSTNDVYVELWRQIDKMPIGMPAKESGVGICILKDLFAPEEKKNALQINIFLEPLERIYGLLKKTDQAITPEELEKVLDRLILGGSILSDEKDFQKLYIYVWFAVGIYEFRVDRLTEEFYEDCEEYIQEEFAYSGRICHRICTHQAYIWYLNRVLTPDRKMGFSML